MKHSHLANHRPQFVEKSSDIKWSLHKRKVHCEQLRFPETRPRRYIRCAEILTLLRYVFGYRELCTLHRIKRSP